MSENQTLNKILLDLGVTNLESITLESGITDMDGFIYSHEMYKNYHDIVDRIATITKISIQNIKEIKDLAIYRRTKGSDYLQYLERLDQQSLELNKKLDNCITAMAALSEIIKRFDNANTLVYCA